MAKTTPASSDLANAINFDDVSLDDKYDLTKSRIFLTGTQAIVRLTLMQKERDRRASRPAGHPRRRWRRGPR